MKDYFDPKSNMMVSDKIAYEEAAKKPTVIIEEYANVDETFQNIKNIKVGSMTLNDLFGDNLKVIENALEERKKLLKWKNSQQDLIKGKDEYIAKLCNDRVELKEQLKQVEDFKHHYDRYKKELANNLKVINCMQEEETTNRNLIDSLEDRNDRLVERLEKQKAELKELKWFARIVVKKRVDVYSILMTVSCIEYNERISYYYPSLADKKYLKKLLLTEEEWQFLKKLMRKEEYGKKED